MNRGYKCFLCSLTVGPVPVFCSYEQRAERSLSFRLLLTSCTGAN